MMTMMMTMTTMLMIMSKPDNLRFFSHRPRCSGRPVDIGTSPDNIIIMMIMTIIMNIMMMMTIIFDREENNPFRVTVCRYVFLSVWFLKEENNPFVVTGPQRLGGNHYQVFGGRLPDTNIMPHLTSPTSNNGPDLL